MKKQSQAGELLAMMACYAIVYVPIIAAGLIMMLPEPQFCALVATIDALRN